MRVRCRGLKRPVDKGVRGSKVLQGKGMDLLRGRKEGRAGSRMRWVPQHPQVLGGVGRAIVSVAGEAWSLSVGGKMSIEVDFLRGRKEGKGRVGAPALAGNARRGRQQLKHAKSVE